MALIHSQNFDGVTAPALPAGWSFAAAFSTSASHGRSSPNALVENVQGSAQLAFTTATDGDNGNGTVSAAWKTISAAGNTSVGVLGRVTNTASLTGYQASYDTVTGTAKLFRWSAGSNIQLGSSVTGGAGGVGNWYNLKLVCQGTTITGYIQRLSDSYWLNTSGTWQQAETHFQQATNADVSGAGQSGLRINQGGGGTVAVDDFEFQSAAAGTIAITSPAAFQIYQRDGSDQAAITISGTYTGDATAIEASWNGGDYVTIDAAPADGAYSGTLSNQAAGQGTLTVRFTNDTDVTATAVSVGIGDVFLVAGQSLAAGHGGSPNLTYTHASLKAGMYRNGWAELADPTHQGIDTTTASASPWPEVATAHMADQGVPVAFIATAEGATAINVWAKGQTYYDRMLGYVQDSGVNGIKAVLWHQGETDASNGMSRADYLAALRQLAADMAADLPGNPPMVVAQCGKRQTAPNGIDAIRLAQSDAWNGGTIHAGPVLYDFDPADGVHLTSASGELQASAARWWAALDQAFYGGTAGRGPRLVTAYTVPFSTSVTLLFDKPLNETTLTTSALAVAEGGVAATISSAAAAGRSATLTLSAPTAGGAMTASLGAQNSGAGATVPTGTDANTLPAEPFVGQGIVPRVVSIGTGGVSGVFPLRSIGQAGLG